MSFSLPVCRRLEPSWVGVCLCVPLIFTPVAGQETSVTRTRRKGGPMLFYSRVWYAGAFQRPGQVTRCLQVEAVMKKDRAFCFCNKPKAEREREGGREWPCSLQVVVKAIKWRWKNLEISPSLVPCTSDDHLHLGKVTPLQHRRGRRMSESYWARGST